MSETSNTQVDWSKWSPAKEGEVRSPCPAINALANHGIIHRDGKNISTTEIITALTTAFHLDAGTAKVFAYGAADTNPHHTDPEQHNIFNLDHVAIHDKIEHDVSLSRDDIALGSNSQFSRERWQKVYDILQKNAEKNDNGVETTNWKACAAARYARVQESRDRHAEAGKEMEYGLKQALLSYGETALYLNLLGRDGKAPLEWVRVLFEEERLPYKEGWRPPAAINQFMMLNCFKNLLEAHPHGAEEAQIVGMGTIQALQAGIFSLIKVPSMSNCVMM